MNSRQNKMEQLILAAGRVASLNATLDIRPYIQETRDRHLDKYANASASNTKRCERWRRKYLEYIDSSRTFPFSSYDFTTIDHTFITSLVRKVAWLNKETVTANVKVIYNFMRNRGARIDLKVCPLIIAHIIDTHEIDSAFPSSVYRPAVAPEATVNPILAYTATPDLVIGSPHSACFSLAFDSESNTLTPHVLIPATPTVTIRFASILQTATPLDRSLRGSPTPGSYYIIPTASLLVIYGIIIVADPSTLASTPQLTI